MFDSIRHRLAGNIPEHLGSTLRDQWKGSAAHQWLEGLAPRDRTIVHVLGLVIAALLVYGAIWKPVADWRDRADQRFRQAAAVHEWIIVNQARLESAGRGGGSRAGGSLVPSAVANSAAAAGIQVTRVQPEGSDGVSVVIQDQDFNQVLMWLDQLTTREQFTIRQLSIDSQANPGRVSVRISLG
jgi:general secretion pathway protein M